MTAVRLGGPPDFYGHPTVLRASNGKDYFIAQYFYNTGPVSSIKIIEITPPSTFNTIATVATSVICGQEMTVSTSHLAAAVDGSDIIHIVVSCITAGIVRNVAYNAYNTGTSQWVYGTWEGISENHSLQSAYGYCDIAVDSNSKPHIIYEIRDYRDGGSDYNRIAYKNRVSGSWTAQESASDFTPGSSNHTMPSIMIDPNNKVYVSYQCEGQDAIYRRERTTGGTWQNLVTYSMGSLVPYMNLAKMAFDGTNVRLARLHTPSPTYPIWDETDTYIGIDADANYYIEAWPVWISNTLYMFVPKEDYIVYYNTWKEGIGWGTPEALTPGIEVTFDGWDFHFYWVQHFYNCTNSFPIVLKETDTVDWYYMEFVLEQKNKRSAYMNCFDDNVTDPFTGADYTPWTDNMWIPSIT